MKPEQIRLLMGQNIGIKFLLPLALNILEKNPLIESDYGFFLSDIMNININYWNKVLFNKLYNIIQKFNMEFDKENQKIIFMTKWTNV